VKPSLLVNEASFSLETNTLPEALERAAAAGAHLWLAAKDKEAVELPMRDLLERASRLARHLLSLGMKPGERAVVMLPTSEGWLAGFFGTLLAGGVAVPLGPNLSFGGMDRYASTVREIMRAAGARFLLGNDAIEPHLPGLRAHGTSLEHFVRADLAHELPVGAVTLPSPSPEATAVIQYTSGTTGTPKGVMLSHRALLANAYMIGERSGMSPADVGVSWLPLFHDMGLVGALLTSLYWHYPLLLMPVESFLLQPRRWITWMSKKRATLTVAPNFAYQFAVDRVAERHLAGLDLSAWRKAFNGSEAVRPGTLRAFTERFGPLGFDESAFEPVYGMAENALAATFPEAGRPWHTAEHAGRELCSVGTPLSGVSVAVVDESGRPAEGGAAGSIRLSSPSLMDGYFENEAATAEVLQHGWLDTGDIGFIRDGELFVTGRKKELIIKRGRNYTPDELENVALEVTRGRVLRAAAFGAPDEREGTEKIVLVLETRKNTAHERELLSRDVSGALVAAVGVGPDVTVVVPPHTIERTTSGKLRRAALRIRFLEGKLPQHEQPDATTSPEEPA
jgi:acyl-CoA synthetase (AMP-forming)/AMP-acid ligase II